MAHILVVDDDADLRQLLLTALERDGHQVTALDRGSAVTEAHCRWAHCILLDVMMPGRTALPPASGSVPWQTVPFSSSPPKPRRPTSSRGLGLGGDDYLTKPFRLGSSGPGSRPTCAGSTVPPSTGSAGAAWILTWGRRRFTGESSR